MTAVNRVRPAALRVDITIPVTRVGFGPFSFDPVEELIGAPIAAILESLLVGPIQRRPSAAGPAVDVYPLALPDGEGASFPLGAWGEIGFHNEAGLLVLTVPLPARGWVERQLADSVVQTAVGMSTDGSSRVAKLWVQLRRGACATWPTSIGEISLNVLVD